MVTRTEWHSKIVGRTCCQTASLGRQEPEDVMRFARQLGTLGVVVIVDELLPPAQGQPFR